MKAVQKKFFDLIDEQLGDKKEGELVVQQQFANTGRGFIQRQGTFVNFSEFTYKFNDSYAEFDVNGKLLLAVYGKTVLPHQKTLDEVISRILAPVPDPVHPSELIDRGERINGGDPACPRR